MRRLDLATLRRPSSRPSSPPPSGSDAGDDGASSDRECDTGILGATTASAGPAVLSSVPACPGGRRRRRRRASSLPPAADPRDSPPESDGDGLARPPRRNPRARSTPRARDQRAAAAAGPRSESERESERESEALLRSLAAAIRKARRCVVIAGAGISVASGIPDFRSANGLYNLVKSRYPNIVLKGRDLFDASLFRDPESTSLFYTFMAELKDLATEATPSLTHHFVKSLDMQGKLLRCYTQ
ncbi:hypothetical protein HK405_010893, partial [Cladochytrium tenue]